MTLQENNLEELVMNLNPGGDDPKTIGDDPKTGGGGNGTEGGGDDPGKK